MATTISPLASVDPRAEIGDGVEIGPFCVIGPQAKIGPGCILRNNVTLMGNVTLGADNDIYPGVVIGGQPQDLTDTGADTKVVVGDGNILREGVTINRATQKEDGFTRVGDDNFLMAYSHVAHDCQLGHHIVTANNVLLAGHVNVHDYVTISGSVGVHHFATIGAYSFIGGLSAVRHDVPPYMLIEGCPAKPRCINVVGLKRNNFPPDVIQALAEAHRLLYRAKVGLDNAWDILRSSGHLLPQVNHLLSFVQDQHEGRHGRSRERRKAA